MSARSPGYSDKTQVPGPGKYYLHKYVPNPAYSFGHEKRDKANKRREPGPGAYNIKSSIPDVPSYLIPSH